MRKTMNNTATAVSLALFGVMGASQASADVLDSTDVSFTGYVKADAMFSNYSEGTLDSGSIGREFYIPSLTPVAGNEEGTQFDAHIRQSRFRFTTQTATDSGDTITGVIALDFIVTDGGNERVSNSYTPRIRHAYLQYKNWLVGQTWTTFMDVSILPESLDFIGVTDGTPFGRQTMVRYSHNGFQIALENPETTVTPFGGGDRVVADDNSVPDLVAAYTTRGDWGHVKVAGLVRQLAYDNGTDIDGTDTGYGIAVSSKINLDNGDDIRLMFNSGSGVGRYTALNTFNGAVVTDTGDLNAVDSYGYTLAYRHVWTDRMRSSVMFSALEIDNDTALSGDAVTASTYSTRANLLYSPTPALTFGGEYAFAHREVESGLEGDMHRVQFSAKYAF
ncbi:porin [Alteromonas sp. ASW11-19]|uniref:Porin n=1 Tax=Alteromonas salexigens TaxID=2982530 RepID=A0ABT2VK71_9ALTE|nr:porin [Alteromonas salexigens]MCU7553675.1 porin [Alteromonas salexigens]